MFFEIHKKSLGLFSKEQLEKIKNSSVAVFGVGGLGNFVSLHLVLSGVGKLYLIDKDRIEISNLNRQFLYSLNEVGNYKVNIAKEKLSKISYNTEVSVICGELEKFDQWTDVDLVVDCLDNWNSKNRLYQLALKYNKPVVFASVNRREGLIGFVKTNLYKLLNYHKNEETSVISTVVGVVGSIEADVVLGFLAGELNKEFILKVDLDKYRIKKYLF